MAKNPYDIAKGAEEVGKAVGKVVKKAVTSKVTKATPAPKPKPVVATPPRKPMKVAIKKEEAAEKAALKDMSGPASFTGPHPQEDSLKILDKNIRKAMASENPNSRRAKAEVKRVAAGDAPDLYKSNIANRITKVFPNNTKLSSVDIAGAKIVADALRSNPGVDTHILGSILEDNIAKSTIDAVKAAKTVNKFNDLDDTTKSAFGYIWDFEKGTSNRSSIEQIIKKAETLLGD